ncbi:response regulator [Pontibacter sp. SGAir0037]|uniref:response regulator n=1 Tax=Pontibacter sp. SGAir0037 TaxID=2571030 RepID=UPI0010CD0ABD|nr:response regulator [Pontibacter sp. SGAir0037]QCR22885.1 response regulator [Pontibacter sp. SGAir0037]
MNEQTTQLDLVLLVDDDETTNYLNKRLLNEMKVAKEIMALKNGQEAIEYLDKAYNTDGDPAFKRPDLIFLDIKMPVMDGFSFLDEYHKRGLDAADHVIILMLTSSASFYDLQRLKNYKKVRKHYSKALTKHDIREIMAEYFKRVSN